MTHDDLKKRAEPILELHGVTPEASLIRDLLAALEKSEARAVCHRQNCRECSECYEEVEKERDEAVAQLATARAAALEEAAECVLFCPGPGSFSKLQRKLVGKEIRALASTPPGVVVLTREEAETVAAAVQLFRSIHLADAPGLNAALAILERKR